MNLLPITMWFRNTVDENNQPVREYNHYEEGHVTQPLPTPKGTTTWKGKNWVGEHQYRTNEIVPKLVNQQGEPL